jgi:hypothetical protein
MCGGRLLLPLRDGGAWGRVLKRRSFRRALRCRWLSQLVLSLSCGVASFPDPPVVVPTAVCRDIVSHACTGASEKRGGPPLY